MALGSDTPPDELPGTTLALYAVLCCVFVVGSGLAAGLTLGLMSLDKMEMQVLLRSGTPKQQRLARTIMPIIADPHWLLVTLLLCNAGCFEALPLFMDVLVNPLGAILISVTLILIFGEILPQAVCARHGLAIGAALGWPVRFFMWLTSPISWPLARLLDWLLGREDVNIFKRAQLKALVDLHGADEGLGGKLSDDEVQIICGALDLTNKIAYSAMTPLDKVVMLSDEQRLDRATITKILASGHSRVPVYAGKNRSNIIGLLLVKELLAHAFPTPEELDRGLLPQVSELKIRPLPRLPASTRCYDMLKLFRTGRAHMVLLTQPEADEGVSLPAATDVSTSAPVLGTQSAPASPRQHAARMAVELPRLVTISPHAAGGHQQHPSQPAHVANHVLHRPQHSTPTRIGTVSVQERGLQRASQPPAAEPASATAEDHPGTASTSSPRLSTRDMPAAQPSRPDSMWPVDRVRRAEAQSHLALNVEGQAATAARRPSGLARLSARLSSWRTRQSAQDTDKVSITSESSELPSEFTEGEPDIEVPQIAQPGEPIGIITIEDVLEELMGQEILDETDQFADNTCTLPADEELRIQLAQRLPERLRGVVLGSGVTLLRLSRANSSRAAGMTSRGSTPRLGGTDTMHQTQVLRSTGNLTALQAQTIKTDKGSC